MAPAARFKHNANDLERAASYLLVFPYECSRSINMMAKASASKAAATAIA